MSILRQRIHERVYPPGGRLPSESSLATELGVSRTTVRTALARFASEGLILRKQGDGTYVNQRLDDVDTHFGGLWDFSRLIEANGYQPSIRTVALEERPISAEESLALEVNPDVTVVSMTRLFYANERPVIYVANVFPQELISLSASELNSDLPIHNIVHTYFEAGIAFVISEIEATFVDSRLQELLHKKVGQPLLRLKETFYTQDHRPLILGISYYDFTTLKLRLVQAWG